MCSTSTTGRTKRLLLVNPRGVMRSGHRQLLKIGGKKGATAGEAGGNKNKAIEMVVFIKFQPR
jgi:hypothetical protein